MMRNLDTLGYTLEHEWVDVVDSTATVGITDFAADKLGDIVYVDLPKIGTRVVAGEVMGEIESTKSVSELFAPVNGIVSAVNDAVVSSPELVNSDPFNEAWLLSITIEEKPQLLTRAQYLSENDS